MLTGYKNKVLDGLYTKHPQGKELLDIDTQELLAAKEKKIEELQDELQDQDDKIEALQEQLKILEQEKYNASE